MACGLIGDKLAGLSVLAARLAPSRRCWRNRTKEIELQLKLRPTERTTSESLQGEFNVVLVGQQYGNIFQEPQGYGSQDQL